MVRERAPCNSVNHQFRSQSSTPAKPLKLIYQFFVTFTSIGLSFLSITEEKWGGKGTAYFVLGLTGPTASKNKMVSGIVFHVTSPG
jgi:hypothetical protein